MRRTARPPAPVPRRRTAPIAAARTTSRPALRRDLRTALPAVLVALALAGCAQIQGILGTKPAITQLAASDPLVHAGDTVTLSWTVTGDEPLTLTLLPGDVDVSGENGHDVAPTTTTHFTLRAENAAGSAERSVDVTVIAAGETALQVSVTGLPGGAVAQVAVTDHLETMRWVRGTDGLGLLPPGAYTVAASPVTSGGTVYLPQPAVQTLTLADGDVGDASVAYSAGDADPYASPPDVPACQGGTLTQQAKDRALARLNFLRSLVGLPVVPYDPAHDAQVQAASLIFAANAAISHTPDGSWACYSSDGAAGAGTSNIAVSAKSNPFVPAPEHFVDLWGDDVDVPSLGHRRWLLDPFLSQVAFGMSSGAPKVGSWPYTAGSAIRVVNAADADVSGLALPFVAYPRGDFPAELLTPSWYLSFSVLADPSSRWNNEDGTVDLSGASVTVEAGGSPLAVTDLAFDYAGQGIPNSLSWKVSGLQVDTEYTVTVDGVKVGGASRSFSYPFRLR